MPLLMEKMKHCGRGRQSEVGPGDDERSAGNNASRNDDGSRRPDPGRKSTPMDTVALRAPRHEVRSDGCGDNDGQRG